MIRYGLDFGTTNSSVSLPEVGGARLLQIDNFSKDPRVIRSLLYFYYRNWITRKDRYGREHSGFEGDFKYEFGQMALEKYLEDNRNRKPGKIRQIFTGRVIDINMSPEAGKADKVAEYYEEVDFGTGRILQALKTALKSSTYKGTNIFGKFFTLEQMIGLFVSLIKSRADEMIGEKVTSLRVGRPVIFLPDKDEDRLVEKRLEEALKMVGFNDIEFEFEPVAAAKYFLYKNKLVNKTVLVFDFGGGTLDVAIVKNDNGFKVLATDGVYIGGNLLNSDIMENKLASYFGSDIVWGKNKTRMPAHIMNSLTSWYSIPSLNNPANMRFFDEIKNDCSDSSALERLVYLIKMNLGFELYEAIEISKKELSSSLDTSIRFSDGPINIDMKFSREEMEAIIEPRICEVKDAVFRCLQSAKLEPGQIDVVVRTGGSSLIPMVEKMLEEIFGSEKVQLFDTFTSIAAGLAID